MKRRTLYLLLLFILIFGLILVNLQIISNRLVTKERVEAMLQDILGLPIKVDKVRFQLFKGIQIDNLQISGNNNRTILSADKIKITYDTIKLLHGQLVFETIQIISPQLNSIEELSSSIKSKTSGISKLPLIIIKNGKIDFSNNSYLKKNYHLVLDNININLYPFAEMRYVMEGNTNAGILGKWLVRGEFNVPKKEGNLTFLTTDLELTEEIAEKLSPGLRVFWERYQPKGTINLGINLIYEPDKNPSLHFSIIVESQNTSIVYHNFPYKVYNIKGKINMSEKGIQLEKLSGNNGSSKISLEGNISDFSDEASYEIKISAEKLKLDNQLFESIPASTKELWKKLTLDGSVDIEGVVTREQGKNKKDSYQIKVIPNNCTANPSYFPFPLTDIKGEVNYTNDEILINSITAYRNKAQLTIKGSVPESSDKKGEVNLIIEGTGIDINDYALRDALKSVVPGSDSLWKSLQPEGTINALVNLKNSGTYPHQPFDVKVQIDCKGDKIKYGPEQFIFSNLQGQIEYQQNKDMPRGTLKFHNLRAENEKTHFEIDGDVIEPNTFISNTSIAPYSLNIKITNLNLNPLSSNLLPADVVTLCKNLDFSSVTDVTFAVKRDYVKSSFPKQINLKTSYTMEMNLSQGSLNPGIMLSEINGKLITQGEISEGGHHSIGSMNLTQMKIAGKRFENILVRFIHENNRISIYNLTASGYQGSANGFFTIILPDYNYQGHIVFSGIDLKDFAQDTFLQGKDITGKIALELDIDGKGQNLSTLNGDGKLFITEGQLWEVPIFLSIFDSFKFGQKSVFQNARVRFQIKNEKIHIVSSRFTSPDILLRGKGTINFNGKLDIQFDTKANSKSIIPVEIMKTLVKLFSKPIYTIKIEGTFKDPKPVLKLLPYLELQSTED